MLRPGPDAGAGVGRRSLGELIVDLPGPSRRGCPAHPGSHGRAFWRNEEKSYFACPVCGVTYLERFAADTERYDASYFMEEYRAQYGKTYLEDFQHIYETSRRRVTALLRLGGEGPARVLDIGCAYGPFLAAARDAGLDAYGVDVAPEAVHYVSGELGIPAASGDILDLDLDRALGTNVFDVVTLWYVIEHFDRLDLLLAKLCSIVRPGGVLAISTPHGAGVSARRARGRFYRESPRDHFTIWDRKSAVSLLGAYGFSVRRITVTGHHPERYPLLGRGAVLRRLASLHSRLFGWGDTFEIYATKEHACREQS